MENERKNEISGYGIEINELDVPSSYDYKIPIDKDAAARLSSLFSAAPTLVANDIVRDQISSGLYTVTLDGKDVLPLQLFSKSGNEAYISNLKGEGGKFGRQADVKPFDSSVVDAAALASSVFAIASVATSQYYLKNIDDKLSEIQETTQHIMEFLEADKQSQLESDFEILGDIIDHMSAIKEDDTLRALKIEQISSIQRESRANIKFYKKLLEKALNDYIANKKGGKQDDKIVQWVRKDYFNYKLSLQVYSLTKLSEIMLLSNYNQDYLTGVYDELKDYSIDLKDDINHILTVIYDSSADKFDNKMKMGFAKTLRSVGNAVDKTPLKKTDLGEKLNLIGSKTDSSIEGDTKRKADMIVTRDDYGSIEPYSDMINSLINMSLGRVSIVKEETEMYLLY